MTKAQIHTSPDSPDAKQLPQTDEFSKSPLIPPPFGVAIRMYRQGLGDCFLLAFSTSSKREDRPFYVLIDCGVLKTQSGGLDRLRLVMENIYDVTCGHINVIVATHEHYDHLSGFVDKQGPFSRERDQKRFTVDELWLAWTEDSDDAAVQLVKKQKSEIEYQFHSLRTKLKTIVKEHGESPLCLKAAEGMLFGDLSADKGDQQPHETSVVPSIDPAAASGMMGTVRKVLSPSRIRYFSPGEIHTLFKDSPVKHTIYVLGPPKKRELLRGEGTEARKDALFFGTGGNWSSLLSAVHHFVGSSNGKLKQTTEKTAFQETDTETQLDDELTYLEQKYPFERQFCRLLNLDPTGKSGWSWRTENVLKSQRPPSETMHFFHDYYDIKPEGASKRSTQRQDGAPHSKPSKETSWRRIDFDWLYVASAIGLKLGSDTNNTSLALAFEIGEPGSGRVLLFPGDAQVGNWWSWQDLEFQINSKSITTSDLLKRTMIYKVSHHGSHNGTPKTDRNQRDWGLSLMPTGGVIALLPVDKKTADKTGAHGKKWDMPAKNLYEALYKKTHGRILRSDEPDSQDSTAKNGNSSDSRLALTIPASCEFQDVPELHDVQWRKAPAKPGESSLYFDLNIRAGEASGFSTFIPLPDKNGERV